MSDRTDATCVIYDCPADNAGKVLEILDAIGLGEDWESWDTEHLTHLKLGHTYCGHEIPCGIVSEYAPALVELGCSFILQEDGYADWLGSVWWHTPALGTREFDCDNNGFPQYGAVQILAAFAEGKFTDEATLEEWLGTAWTKAFQALTETNRDVELPA